MAELNPVLTINEYSTQVSFVNVRLKKTKNRVSLKRKDGKA